MLQSPGQVPNVPNRAPSFSVRFFLCWSEAKATNTITLPRTMLALHELGVFYSAEFRVSFELLQKRPSLTCVNFVPPFTKLSSCDMGPSGSHIEMVFVFYSARRVWTVLVPAVNVLLEQVPLPQKVGLPYW